MNLFININGKTVLNNLPVLQADNHSYRYADGLFETMKIENGKIKLEQYHFERLFNGLMELKFEFPGLFTRERMREEILQLCKKNKSEMLGRVRLSVSRGNGGLYDNDKKFQYLIECQPLEETINKLNENGLVIDIYPDARKSIDKFSGLKSANYLPYVMAAIWAKENKLNDALVLNSKERICDASVANVFWVKEGIIITVPLDEGCIAGVMRRNLIEQSIGLNIKIKEKELHPTDLETADEVFLTNTISGIRWVYRFRNKTYANTLSAKLFKNLVLLT